MRTFINTFLLLIKNSEQLYVNARATLKLARVFTFMCALLYKCQIMDNLISDQRRL